MLILLLLLLLLEPLVLTSLLQTNGSTLLWSCCFALGYAPSALLSVVLELSLQNEVAENQAIDPDADSVVYMASPQRAATTRSAADADARSKRNQGPWSSVTRPRMFSTADQRKVSVVYFYAWLSLYQTVWAVLFFWTSLLPHFGTASSVAQLLEQLKFGAACTAGVDLGHVSEQPLVAGR